MPILVYIQRTNRLNVSTNLLFSHKFSRCMYFLKKDFILLVDERNFSATNFCFLIIKYKMASLSSECWLIRAYTDVVICRSLAKTNCVTCCFTVLFTHPMTRDIIDATNNINSTYPLVCRHRWKMTNHSISFNNCHFLFTVIWIIIGLSRRLSHNEHDKTDKNQNKLFRMHGTYMKSIIIPS